MDSPSFAALGHNLKAPYHRRIASSPSRCVYEWLAGVVVNVAFLVGIIIGFVFFSRLWLLALVLSLLYPTLLFFWIRHFPMINFDEKLDKDEQGNDKKEGGTAGDERAQESPEENLENDGEQTSPQVVIDTQEFSGTKTRAEPFNNIPLALTLLYGAFCLAVGFPGGVLGYLISPCDWRETFEYDKSRFRFGEPIWQTNYSNVPPEVKQWDQDHPIPNSCYGYRDHRCVSKGRYVTLHDVLYFSGAVNQDADSHVMAMPMNLDENGAMPKPYPIGGSRAANPIFLTTVRGEYLCFASLRYSGVSCGMPQKMKYEFRSESDQEDSYQLHDGNLYNLADFGGRLWLQKVDYKHNGHAIVSLDPLTMTAMLHSELVEEEDYLLDASFKRHFGCAVRRLTAGTVACLFLLTALPIVFVSGWLWIKQAIPSSSIAFFLGMGLVVATLFGFLSPSDMFAFFSVYCTFVAPIWILVCTFILAVGRHVSRGPLLWSVQFLIFGFFLCIMAIVVDEQLFYEEENSIGSSSSPWGSISFGIVFALIPMGLVGIILDSWFILSESLIATTALILSGMVFSLRETSMITMTVMPTLVGALLLAAGIYANRFRQVVHQCLLNRLVRCTRHLCSRRREEEQDSTESLLLCTHPDEAQGYHGKTQFENGVRRRALDTTKETAPGEAQVGELA